MPGELLIGGFARVFLEEAARAAGRAGAAPAHAHSEVAGATATAVLLSTAALEAAVSEYATLVQTPPKPIKPLPAETVRDIRDGNDPLYTRFEKLLRFYAAGADCQNQETFKDVRCLVELRNAFAHRRAEFRKAGEWPDSLQNCKPRIPFFAQGRHDWTSDLLVPAVADWAVETARKWLIWVATQLPQLSASPLTVNEPFPRS